MANINAPFGLKPVSSAFGGVNTGALHAYYVRADNSTAMYVGDPVVLTTDGANAAVVQSGTVTHPIGTLRTVTKASLGDSDPITGVIVSIEAQPLNRTLTYVPGNTECVVMVADDPRQLFECQVDGTSTVTVIGSNADLTAGSGGSTVTGMSSVQILHTSFATTDTHQVTVVGVSNAGGRGDPGSAYCVLLVRLNNSTEVNGSTAIPS